MKNRRISGSACNKRQLFACLFRLTKYPFNNLLRERREWNDAFQSRRFIFHLNPLPATRIQWVELEACNLTVLE